jgi:hypothetical protein
MEPLDGNAIAGALHAHFGVEMTVARGVCGHCGTGAQIGELRVYMRAPGAVVRCRTCGWIVMVLVEIGGDSRVHLPSFELLDR